MTLFFFSLFLPRKIIKTFFICVHIFPSPIAAERRFPHAPGTKKLDAAMPSRRFLWFTPNPVRGFHLAGVKKKTTEACRRGGVDNRSFRYLESENDSRVRGYTNRRQCGIYFSSANSWPAVIDDEEATTRANRSPPELYRTSIDRIVSLSPFPFLLVALHNPRGSIQLTTSVIIIR